ncbi:MAG: putative N-acetylmannosamine-6-phosphate 2-epimerase [Vicinamibacterales bacterium]|jgi:putative N-acetylmannosamine-6-phosphate epimerase|nr:putative N-acetylmannosamine-6-phosphate 2-epimerase [Vicinamibacterales bacterium]
MASDLPRGLVVSCQAEGDSPFNAPGFIVAFAKAAEMGGAVGVRICGVENVAAVRQAVRVPIVGLTKARYPDGSVLITPGEDEARALVEAGADYVALDATARPRPTGASSLDVLRAVRDGLGARVFADVSTLDEGIAAAAAGATLVATSLAGYTPDTAATANAGPDLDLVARLAARLPGQVVAEGRLWAPDEARAALARGAYAVVVGTAITRPVDIVRRWVAALGPLGA